MKSIRFNNLMPKRPFSQITHRAINSLKIVLIISLFSVGASQVMAEQVPELPLLVIGASWANGALPLNDDMEGVKGGLNIGLGRFLDLGKALVKDPRLPGYVINEAVAGASTEAHRDCSLDSGTACSSVVWISMEQQFQRALRRVANPAIPGTYPAEYVVITPGVDCLHSNTKDIPEVDTFPCEIDDINAYIDNMINLGEQVLDAGLTPIFLAYPPLSGVDLSIPQRGFVWFIDNDTWELMSDIYTSRLQNELPAAVFLDVWDGFEHNGDGLHQTDKVSRQAAKVIAKAIKN